MPLHTGMRKTESTKNLTKGNPERVILEFAMPLFLSQLFQQLYNSADALIVGNFLGKNALAAVSSSGTLIFLLTSFAIGIATGAGVVISRYFGAGDRKRVSDAIHTDVAFGIVFGLFLSVFGVLMTPYILRWMGTDPAVLPESVSYFRNYFYGAIAVVLYNLLRSIMNALGDSKRPLYYLIVSSLLNIVLDYLFVGVFHWGTGSAAVATTISQAVSVVLCLNYLMGKKTEYRLVLRKIRFHREMLSEIVRYGLPAGVQNSVIGFANVLVQSNINSFGADAMAGCGAYTKLEGFAFLPVTSFSMALTTFIGQNLGAAEYERAKKGARFGIWASLLIAEAIGAALYLLAPQLISLFDDDPEIVRIGAQVCRVVSLFYCLLSFSHCIAGICRGAGKATVPMVVMLAVWCVLRIIYITVMMRLNHDIRLLYWAYPLTWAVSSAIFLVYYLKSDWIHGFVKHGHVAESQ